MYSCTQMLFHQSQSSCYLYDYDIRKTMQITLQSSIRKITMFTITLQTPIFRLRNLHQPAYPKINLLPEAPQGGVQLTGTGL